MFVAVVLLVISRAVQERLRVSKPDQTEMTRRGTGT